MSVRTTADTSQAVLPGIALYMVALTGVIGATTVGKIVIDTMTVWQIVLAQMLGLLVAGFVFGRTLNIIRLLRTNHPFIQIARTFCQFGAVVCFYHGLPHLPLADITGIMLLLPLVITALAALLLGEQVGWRRWTACVTGLLGAFLIARPGMPGTDPGALWPFGTVVLFAFYTVLTRKVSADDPAPNSMVWAALATVTVLALASPNYWEAPSGSEWLGLVGIAVFSGVANSARIKALGLAPASVLAPFGHTQIVTATLVGLVVFDDLPDALSFAGIGIIVGAGLYVWHRERVRGAAAQA
ncbi:MAG: DMT family transporter [Rhodospirillales bacterium]|nr:DMT family transporter [Rhodospirillales bacterium]